MKTRPSEAAQALIIYFLIACVVASFYSYIHWDKVLPWYLSLWQRASRFLAYGVGIVVALFVFGAAFMGTPDEEEQ